jgi:hypothetical protein
MQGVCYARAQEQGIAHAQLPIGTYIQMASRKVLAINHGTPDKPSKHVPWLPSEVLLFKTELRMTCTTASF